MTLYLARLMHGTRALTAERFEKDTLEGARLYAQHDFMLRNRPNGLAPSDLTVHLLHRPDPHGLVRSGPGGSDAGAPTFSQWAAVAKLEAISGKWVWSYPPAPGDSSDRGQ